MLQCKTLLCCYERGKSTLYIGVTQKLANFFGVKLDYLVSDKEVPNILQDKVRQAYRVTG